MEQVEKNYLIELSKKDLSIIASFLAEGQYKIVNSLIYKIDKQIKEQDENNKSPHVIETDLESNS